MFFFFSMKEVDDMYSALDIARYVISVCFKKNLLISNLKLQKMLYFVWVDFYKITGRKIFEDDICAWPLGPVVPTVYYEYCSYAGRPISEYYKSNINSGDSVILDSIIINYGKIPANELVDKTHKKGSAWDTIYRNGAGNRKVIPFELIIEKEVG